MCLGWSEPTIPPKISELEKYDLPRLLGFSLTYVPKAAKETNVTSWLCLLGTSQWGHEAEVLGEAVRDSLRKV